MANGKKGTPELEALIGVLIFTQCRVDALADLLRQKGVLVSLEEVDNKSQSIFSAEFELRRQRIIDTMTNPDIRSTLDES